ncbi:hypothetical protein BDA99DRAFT_508636 [Phascolomyces articulosus]|uniref:Uncharacterized protein n=1 Tax=Phascolomyces articulosus TaxID=60185 RepID=A0AAD5K0W8_9FUNG|nr:hypothetical protein BDA99DRAFT_508636 [Phascolomyces articulosus]
MALLPQVQTSLCLLLVISLVSLVLIPMVQQNCTLLSHILLIILDHLILLIISLMVYFKFTILITHNPNDAINIPILHHNV